jgi:hypothetical protein
MIVNVRRNSRQAIRKIKRIENSRIIEEPVSATVWKRHCHDIVEMISNHLANVIDGGHSGARGVRERYIDGQKQTGIPKKSMKFSTSISIIANDLAVIIDADSLGQICAREIENGAATLLSRKNPADLSNQNLERRYWNLNSVGDEYSSTRSNGACRLWLDEHLPPARRSESHPR